MFWNKDEQVLVVEPEVPKAVTLAMGEAEANAEEYEALCRKIGWVPRILLGVRVRKFLAENGIGVYPFEKVEAFLDQKFGREIIYHWTWCWRAIQADQDGADVGRDQRDWLDRLRTQNGHLRTAVVYNQAIPMPVLETIFKVREAFPEVYFFVSDMRRAEDRNKDPFLMIVAPGMEPMVIERWDEPTFRS